MPSRTNPRTVAEPQPKANTYTGTSGPERSPTAPKSDVRISCASPPGTDMPLVLVILGQPQIPHIGDLGANLHDLATIGQITRTTRLRPTGHFDFFIDQSTPF